MIAIFYFALIRPQRKREKEVKDMRGSLAIGDEILTIGGIVGTIIQVKEDLVVIESSGMKTRLEVMKWGVSSVVKKKNHSNNKKQAAQEETSKEEKN